MAARAPNVTETGRQGTRPQHNHLPLPTLLGIQFMCISNTACVRNSAGARASATRDRTAQASPRA
eukprot:3061801-Pleurochrysis_carterae.AAC.1